MEDPTHLAASAGQFVVFGDSFLSLQDPDFNAFLRHKVQRGGRDLRGDRITARLHRDAFLEYFYTKQNKLKYLKREDLP